MIFQANHQQLLNGNNFCSFENYPDNNVLMNMANYKDVDGNIHEAGDPYSVIRRSAVPMMGL
jgi:hypothetical protein